MEGDAAARLDAVIRGLAAYRPPDDRWVASGGGERLADGTASLPFATYGPAMHAYWDTLQAGGLTLAKQDYLAWREANGPVAVEAIASLDHDDLDRLATGVYRAERFVTGLWSSSLNDGTLLAIAVRLRDLLVGAAR